MKRKPPPDEIPRLGPLVRKLADGRVMTRAADAVVHVQNVNGHGRVLLREVTWSREDGRVWKGWQWDLSQLQPPPGAILANPELQIFCCSGPKLWYEDDDRTCVQCGLSFTFSASEQRYWYETLAFHESSTAIRCLRCRKARRSRKALHAQLAMALRATEALPKDPHRWLELARVTAELGRGDRARAISAARRAWRLSKEQLPEALFWEANLQRAAGRDAKALELEERFLALAGPDRRSRELVKRLQA